MKNIRLLLIAIILVGIIIFQIRLSEDLRNSSVQIYEQIDKMESSDISIDKLKQEIINLKIENKKKTIFWQLFLNNIASAVGIFAAFAGGYIIIQQYIANKKSQNQDRNYTLFEEIYSKILGDEQKIKNEKAAYLSTLGLFLSADKSEFHERVAILLNSIKSDINKNKIIEEAYINIFMKAIEKIPSEMRKLSWANLRLHHCIIDTNLHKKKFKRIDLRGFDFRDSKFYSPVLDQGSNFYNCLMDEIDLSGAELLKCNFERSSLRRAKMSGADLFQGNFAYVDFTNAYLDDIYVERLNMYKANLKDVRLSKRSIKWDLIKNKWSLTGLSPDLKEYLVKMDNYFPMPEGKKVLVLLTEFPPYVKGGLWTAVNHQIISERKAGGNIAVVVPFPEKDLNLNVLGADIDVLPVPPAKSVNGYGNLSPYSSYNSFDYNPYIKSQTRELSTYGVNPYSGMLMDDLNEYCNDVIKYVWKNNLDFDIIHAHDWVTFPVAEALAEEYHKPWIAHFHSTEYDRNKTPDKNIVDIEKKACIQANKIIVPSNTTQQRIEDKYDKYPNKIQTVYNWIKDEKLQKLNKGSFDKKRIGFAGRVTWQKGVDTFLEIAKEYQIKHTGFSYVVYGTGESKYLEKQKDSVFKEDKDFPIEFREHLNWFDRFNIFNELSAIIVPSRHEPFGMIIVEAMQAGVPVLYTDQAGIAEILQSELILDSTNIITDSCEKLEKLFENKEYWQEMVDMQYALVEKLISLNSGRTMLDIWKDVSIKNN